MTPQALPQAVEEQQPPCNLCGAIPRYDTVLPSSVWNEVIREAGIPEFLCAACIFMIFVKNGRSFTCELWGDHFKGVPVSVQVRSRQARIAQRLSTENTELRWKLGEAERACQQFRERIEALEGRAQAPAPDEAELQDDDPLMVNAVTAVVREADDGFQKSGGSSRHWVRDWFLPLLNKRGLFVVKRPAPCPCGLGREPWHVAGACQVGMDKVTPPAPPSTGDRP